MAKYRKSYSQGKTTYSNKQKEDASTMVIVILGGIVTAIILFLTIGAILIFMPAIIMTSIINFCYFNLCNILLAPNYLWGITLSFSLLIVCLLLYKLKNTFWKVYGIAIASSFAAGGLFSLFFPRNFLISTIIQMYPYLIPWIG